MEIRDCHLGQDIGTFVPEVLTHSMMEWWGALPLYFMRKTILLEFSGGGSGSGAYNQTQHRQGALRGQVSECAGLRSREEWAVGEGAEGLCFIHFTMTIV